MTARATGDDRAVMFERLVDHLACHGDAVAVITAEKAVTYAELATQVATRAEELGTCRKLVLLETRNDLPTLVTYLGALAGHHVVLPVPAGGDNRSVVDTYRPDVIVTDGVVTDGPRYRTTPNSTRTWPCSFRRPAVPAPLSWCDCPGSTSPPTPILSPPISTSPEPTGPQRLCRCRTAMACR